MYFPHPSTVGQASIQQRLLEMARATGEGPRMTRTPTSTEVVTTLLSGIKNALTTVDRYRFRQEPSGEGLQAWAALQTFGATMSTDPLNAAATVDALMAYLTPVIGANLDWRDRVALPEKILNDAALITNLVENRESAPPLQPQQPSRTPWLLIGGGLAAALVVGLVLFLVLKKK